MTTDYRDMCAELTDDLEERVYGYLINYPADEHASASFERIDRARVLLAQSDPPSLKEQALEKLSNLESDEPRYRSGLDTIRRALEALPNG